MARTIIQLNDSFSKRAYIVSLCLYFLCLPLDAINIGAIGSALKIIALLPMGFALIRLPHIKISKFHVLYFAYICACFLSLINSKHTDISLSKIITFIQLFLLMLTAGCCEYSADDIRFLKNTLIWASRISLILILLLGTYRQNRLVLHNEIIKEDPNYFCLYLSFGIIYCLQKIFKKTQSNFLYKILGIGELIVYLFVIVYTGSRGGLLAILFACFAYILFYTNKSSSFRKLIIIVAIALILYFVLQTLSENMQTRFTIDDVVESGGTHRIDIWAQGIDLFVKGSFLQKVFGYGISTTRLTFIEEGYYYQLVMHNIFLETLVEIGVLGLIVYCYMIFYFLKEAFKNNDKFSFAVIIGMIVMSISTSLSSFKPYINIMILIICLSRKIKQQSEG